MSVAGVRSNSRLHGVAIGVLTLLFQDVAWAGEIQPYQAQQIKPYQAHEIQQYQAREVQPYQAREVQQYQAQQVQQYQGQQVQQYQAQQIQQYNAQVMERQKQPANNVAAMFGRNWRLHVPGATYQTENVAAETRTLHVSPGSGQLPHVLHIASNGIYTWVAYGKTIKGRWIPGDSGYPVILKRAYEGKDWKATMDKGGLLLWDGQSLAGQFRGN